MSWPVQIDDVWKTFGSTAAVRGLSLNVPPKSVYGFLGPNGAGKSTTIRMMLGLQRPDRGRITLFGQSQSDARQQVLGRVGSMVEAPALYQHLTGRENLEVHRRLLAIPQRAIDEALDTVELASVGDRLVRNYSSGMKQRLGIALALLGTPELLILDEPTNGLDPAGIHDVRKLVRDLPARLGMTVFLSSHLLVEVEQVATHIAILSQGQLKFEGTPEELRHSGSERIVIAVNQPEQAAALLGGMGMKVTVEADRLVIAAPTQYDPAEINTILVQAGMAVRYLATERSTLEDAFLLMTASLGSEKEHAHP
jgi:ABC-2 type transport system ATP-binding protein